MIEETEMRCNNQTPYTKEAIRILKDCNSITIAFDEFHEALVKKFEETQKRTA